MRRFNLVVYLLLIVLLAVATVVEQLAGTDYVSTHLYHAPWFMALWGVLALGMGIRLVRRRLWQRPLIFLLHLSFFFIGAGALTTHYTGRQGYMHLTVGSPQDVFMEEGTHRLHRLPFSLRLDSFKVCYHPGSDAPADYVSYLHDAAPVSMNRILRREGYRFYQSSYDADGRGSWLLVSHDPWGMAITYTGYLLFVLALAGLLVGRRGEYRSLFRRKADASEPPVFRPKNRTWALWGLYLAFFCQLAAYLYRWMEAGRMPLSNGYETLQLLALCILLLACLLCRRLPFLLPYGWGLSVLMLLLAWMGPMDDALTPLLPVLASPLLTVHVLVIILAYALFAFLLLNGLVGLALPRHSQRLMRLSRLLLLPAVALLAVGIVLGAVWGNLSWGRYWAWDPKEVWALITLLLYALPLHRRSLTCFRRPAVLHAYLVGAFLAVLMTYLGVTYLLGGMHSYAA